MKTEACDLSSKRKIVLISVGKPQLGERDGDHGEKVKKYRKFCTTI